MATASSRDFATGAARIADVMADLPGALLPILHAVQEEYGYIPREAVQPIAEALNLSRAEVHGVISFYHHFRQRPVGRRLLQICRAEACQSVGALELEARVKQLLGIDYHETTEDQAVSLEPVYCLGNCACAPSIMLGDSVYGRVTIEQVGSLLEGSP